MQTTERPPIGDKTPPEERRPISYTEAVIAIGRQHPELVKDRDRHGIVQILREDYAPRLCDDMCEELLSIQWGRLFPDLEKRERRRLESEAAKAAAAARVAQGGDRIVADAARNLLDLMLANDKRLGDCTRDDLERESGWLKALAKRVKLGKTVRECLTAEEVAETRRKLLDQ